MWYGTKEVTYPNMTKGEKPSQSDLLRIMEEYPEYRYLAICDYLGEATQNGEVVDIEAIEEKYYTHPVDTCIQKHYLISFFYLAYYHFQNDLFPLKAMDYLHMALQEKLSYDAASALLIKFYLFGFGVKKSEKKAKEAWNKARKEIESWPERFIFHYLSVFNMKP